MNPKQKSILETYKGFLAQNIIWTDILYSHLQSYGLLTESMLDDVKEEQNKYGKADRLIQWLFVREKKHFHTLCDILQLSGHTFVADFLREEEKSSEVIDTKALFEILPSLEKCLGQQQRVEVENFIKQKVKELRFRNMWKQKNTEKQMNMEVKNLQLEQSYEYHLNLKLKENQIQELKGEIESYDKEKDRLGKEVSQLKKEVKDVEIRCHGEKELHIRHNRASESSLKRLGGHLEFSKNLLRTTHQKIISILELRPRSCDKDLVAVMENEFAFFSDDFGKFLQRFHVLEESQKDHESLKAETNWVLTHLGFNPQDEKAPSLTQAYREFAVRTDDNIAKLKRELSIKKRVLHEQEAQIHGLSVEKESEKNENLSKAIGYWQRFVFASLLRQLQWLQDDNQEKDELIKLITKENQILNEMHLEGRAITSADQISKEYTEKITSKKVPDTDREKVFENSESKARVISPDEVVLPGNSENSPLIVHNVPILNNGRPFSKQASPRMSSTKIKNSQSLSEAGLGGGLTASSVKMVSRNNSRKRLV